MPNFSIRITSEGGCKNITPSSSIIAMNGTSEMLVESILCMFKESRGMLKAWKQVTRRMYPNLPLAVAFATQSRYKVAYRGRIMAVWL